MLMYECNECGEIIQDEDSMVTYDIMNHVCAECDKAEKAKED